MSAPIMSALLGNSQHPEYGSATIPFPLSREEYPNSLELLSALEIGDAVDRDCAVLSIQTEWTSLRVLEGQCVNVDELDYLAKRLDSFSKGETAQFEGMADMLKLKDIKDLINLTFCCQKATVITDFSNLEEVGKAHYMNLRGGCVPTEELENLDGVETAYLLIRDNPGAVTPFGVVYDNGMVLEQCYDGHAFPPYLYDADTVMTVKLICHSQQDASQEALLCLPAPDLQIQRTLNRLGVNDIHDVEIQTDDFLRFESLLETLPLAQESLYTVNAMCAVLAPMDQADQQKFCAAAEMARLKTVGQVQRLTEAMDLFSFIPDVRTPEDYGRYMIQETDRFEFDNNLEDYYDYRRFGQDRMDHELGAFTWEGYIAYYGELSLDEVMYGVPCQRRSDLQMGGMA